MAVDIKNIAREYILESRMKGERTIAKIRLIVLGPLFLFAIAVAASGIQEKGIGVFTEITFILEVLFMLCAVIMSFWTLRQIKKKIYHDWMQYIIPVFDIALVSATVYIVSAPTTGLMFTGGAPWIYLLFLAINALRNSRSSVLFTGVLMSLAHLLLCINSMAAMNVLGVSIAAILDTVSRQSFKLVTDTGTIELLNVHMDGFVNPLAPEPIRIMLDDVIFKSMFMLIITGLLAYMAHRFNRMIENQIAIRVEKETLRTTLVTELKTVTETIHHSSNTLVNTSRDFSLNLDQMVNSCTQIQDETHEEYSAVEQTSATITQMIHSIESVAKHIVSQADLVTSSVSAIEEIGASIYQITTTSKKANSLALNLLSTAENGEQIMEDVVGVIQETEAESRKIEEIVEIISSIATETDLLAMNAAIEAAHAGDAGKGFAVVADEIRSLAESSGSSAKTIADILKSLGGRIKNIVELTENSSKALTSILKDARETSQINNEILTAMEEESGAVNEIVRSTQELSKITEEVRQASSEQALGSAEILQVISHIKSQTDTVSSLTSEQMEKSGVLSSLMKELNEVVRNNQIIIDGLDELVGKL
ncbi:MAG: methyl-accepting chemotaxis protein [Spirochaetales bacterium]|nr:methyl-accepting chemotaxis protein [Spirochaetales bacterium]